MTEAAIEKAIRTARCQLLVREPLVAPVLCGLRDVISDEHGPTAATNGKEIYWSPDFVSGLKPSQLLAIVAHECYHVALEHPWRAQEIPVTDQLAANIAADEAINELLGKSGHDLPLGMIQGPPERFGWSFEARYRAIAREMQQDAGAAAWLRSNQSAQAEQGRILPQADQASRQAAAAARGLAEALARACGNDPTTARRVAMDVDAARIRWRDVLSADLADIARGHDEQSYAVRDRRRSHLDLGGAVLAGWIGAEPGRVLYAVDSSGSMSDRQVAEALHHLDTLESDYPGIAGQLVAFDTVLHGPWLLRERPDEIPRGGTSYEPVTRYAVEMAPRLFVVVTDGECERYGPDPECRTIWLVVAPRVPSSFRPPFGEVVLAADLA